MDNEPLTETIKTIEAVHKVFGAPGDYGYDTPEGDALFALYRLLHKLRQLTN